MRAPISTGIREATRKTRAAIWAACVLAFGLLATTARADPLQIVGYAGYLGEWELTATVTEEGSSAPAQYSGALSMKHVGLCSQEGPEEKAGRMQIRMASSSARLQATLWLDGLECSYTGIRNDFYSGTMNCAGRETVPLKLWVK
jgi:hypothetical protein